MTRTDPLIVAGSSRSRGFAHAPSFWIVAGALLVTMAFSLVPTPPWTLYQQRDGFDRFMITVVFAAFALAAITSLSFAGRLSDRLGRRTILMPAILLEILSAVLFITWNDLTGLIIARVISGLGIGLLMTSATVHLLELHFLARPGESRVRADIVSTAAKPRGVRCRRPAVRTPRPVRAGAAVHAVHHLPRAADHRGRRHLVRPGDARAAAHRRRDGGPVPTPAETGATRRDVAISRQVLSRSARWACSGCSPRWPRP
jgi:hypothetical protein